MTTENILRKAQTGEPTDNPGQFGSHARAEAEVTFTAPESVQIAASFTLWDSENTEEAPYPKTMPEPEVSINWDNGAKLLVYVGDEYFEFWSNSIGEHFDTTEYGTQGRFAEADTDEDVSAEREAFIEWGNGVCDCMEANVYAASMAAVSADVERKILDVALGRPRS